MNARIRIRIALAALLVAAGAVLAATLAVSWPKPQPHRPWAGPAAVAHAWLDAVRLGDGSTACGLFGATLLARMGGTLGGCAARFQDPRPMQFRILSVSRRGEVFRVAVETTRELGTIEVHQEGHVYRILRATFRAEPAVA